MLKTPSELQNFVSTRMVRISINDVLFYLKSMLFKIQGLKPTSFFELPNSYNTQAELYRDKKYSFRPGFEPLSPGICSSTVNTAPSEDLIRFLARLFYYEDSFFVDLQWVVKIRFLYMKNYFIVKSEVKS